MVMLMSGHDLIVSYVNQSKMSLELPRKPHTSMKPAVRVQITREF